jgi:hypothetical protein
MAPKLASIERPRMAWYEDLKSATSKLRYYVWKFSSVSKVTGRETRPMG